MASVSHPAVETRSAAAALLTPVGLARVALGIAALHVVDDNFLQPQPGTSALEHLPGGLVQLALFVVLAWSFPRLRPGVQGAVAIFVGLFTIVMGAGEAGYYTRENGASGDDSRGSSRFSRASCSSRSGPSSCGARARAAASSAAIPAGRG
jgi:hypothetical protein